MIPYSKDDAKTAKNNLLIAILQKHNAVDDFFTFSARDQAAISSSRFACVFKQCVFPVKSQSHVEVKTDAADLVTTNPFEQAFSKNATMGSNGIMDVMPIRVSRYWS